MGDNGLVALERIHKELLIDEPWTIRGDRRFSWIGHRLQQSIVASKIFDDKGISLSRLSASCTVVDEVSAPKADVLKMLTRMNRHAVGSAYTFRPASRSITADSVTYVHDDTVEWRSKQFSALSIIQLSLAETEADWLADKAGGAVANREHPVNGRRLEADDMLSVLDDPFAKFGRQPSVFADKFEMETIAETTMRSYNAASLGGDSDGVSLEVSFANGTSLTTLKTGEPHRRLGNGLSVRLNLPIPVAPEDADRIAATLNAQEAKAGAYTTHYGAWCWDDWPVTGMCVAYQAFMPNSLHQPGVAQDVSYSFVNRALWVDRILNAKPSELSVWETLNQRFGGGQDDNDEY